MTSRRRGRRIGAGEAKAARFHFSGKMKTPADFGAASFRVPVLQDQALAARRRERSCEARRNFGAVMKAIGTGAIFPEKWRRFPLPVFPEKQIRRTRQAPPRQACG